MLMQEAQQVQRPGLAFLAATKRSCLESCKLQGPCQTQLLKPLIIKFMVQSYLTCVTWSV